MKKIRVALYTGNRAEYGLQYPLIRELANDPRFEYYLLVSGAHLDSNFGLTINEIKDDGFRIHATVDISLKDDSLYATAQAIGSGVVNISEVLKDLKPDIFIVYADRFESFAALIAGTQMGIPTAHVEGGDVTEGGALDDSVRHAMTKLAHIHFTSNEDASNRLKKMGEEPWRIFTVGFPVIDLIREGNFARPEELSKKYDLDLTRPLVIYTQHSIATEFENAHDQVDPALNALIRLAQEDVQIVMTFPNNDAGATRIMKKLESVDLKSQKNAKIYKSLGRYNYHGFLNICGRITNGACVGNSSSGIKETPAFGCPVVNIGDRQKGRLRADNVIDAPYDTDQIYLQTKKCLFDQGFRTICKNCENPYGAGDVAKNIINTLANVNLDLKLLQKRITY